MFILKSMATLSFKMQCININLLVCKPATRGDVMSIELSALQSNKNRKYLFMGWII